MSRALAEAGYVVSIAAAATYGFAAGSTAAIVLAALLALPAAVVAVISFYGVYGLLALVPGANPSSASGSGSCSSDGTCQVSVSGDPAAWFTWTTDVIGVLALTVAALLNVMLLRRGRRRTPVDDDFAGTPPGW